MITQLDWKILHDKCPSSNEIPWSTAPPSQNMQFYMSALIAINMRRVNLLIKIAFHCNNWGWYSILKVELNGPGEMLFPITFFTFSHLPPSTMKPNTQTHTHNLYTFKQIFYPEKLCQKCPKPWQFYFSNCCSDLWSDSYLFLYTCG